MKTREKKQIEIRKTKRRGAAKEGFSKRERERESSLSIGVPLATTKKREFSLIHNALSLYPNN